MTADDYGLIGAIDASSVTNIDAVAKELQLDLGTEHQIWCKYVYNQGARFVVLPGKLPGKGMGMVAARDIEAGEQIVQVPAKLLFTTNCIPSNVKKRHYKSSGHALLVAGLVHEMHKPSSPYKLWTATWPSIHDLEASMPLFLHTKYRKPLLDSKTGKRFLLLPPAIGGTWIDLLGNLETEYESAGALPKQEMKLTRHSSSIGVKEPNDIALTRDGQIDQQTFRWMWLMVNARSFYYDLPLRTKPKNKEDKMCLCPFLDYFNHDDKGCNVAYDAQGFTITADRAYKRGEEVVICYGAHSNDLLWTDYGFLLNKNDSDSACIDAWMLDPSTTIADPENRELLEEHAFWRYYTISKDGPCYRTEMAIQTQTLSRSDWQRLTKGEDIRMPEENATQAMRAFLAEKILKPCIDTCKFTQEAIQAMDSDLPETMLQLALQRWKQIQELAEKCS